MSDSTVIDLDRIKETFFVECDEHISEMESSILELEKTPDDTELLNSIFRAVHSMKGNSGCLGFMEINSFTHTLETVLDRMRNRELRATGDIISILLESVDCIKGLVDSARHGRESNRADREGITGRLKALLKGEVERRVEDSVPADGGEETLRVVFVPGRDLLKRGMDPLVILRELSTRGRIVSIRADTEGLPGIEELDPECCYISWEIVLSGRRDVVDEVFEFVRDESEISISGEDGVRGDERKPVPDDGAVSQTQKKVQVRDASTIRVDTRKLDRLVNLVGELLITQAMVSQLASEFITDGTSPLQRVIAQLERNTREVQEGVMSIRMLPVGDVFTRFRRMVRDLATKRDKKVRLCISGEDTELDKTVIEKLVDPLTHLLRNSIDHGIEPPSERVGKGKKEEGTIHLNAFHEGGKVVITVEDDGRGIDKDRVLEKAIQRGLVEGDGGLSEKEILGLIFLPGFSTSEKVTDVSGRGVGMDVVKRNIEALGGSVDVETRRDEFTRFVLRLPLTLAVIDGLIVAVGEERFVIPITTVLESRRPLPEEVKTVEGKGEVMNFRGNYVPIVRLHSLMGIRAREERPWQALVVVVVVDGREYGILVDDILGEQQVVIKGMGGLHGISGIAGATILGDGRVALILDGGGIVRRAFSN